jgi:hypothetical protein
LPEARSRAVRAGTTLAICIASSVTLYALCRVNGAQAGPAILAGILAIGLARRPNPRSRTHAITAPLTMAGTALAAVGVGWLLHENRVAGAIAFTAAMFVSIWLRNFGARARTAGALVAMPLVALLVVPAPAAAPGGLLVDVALFVAAGIVPLWYLLGFRWLAQRFGRAAAVPLVEPQPESFERRPSGGVSVSTRMALQMAVALGAAFVVGFALFPRHSGWSVLTAFIVCSGARGRGDAAYKGVLRLAGAAGGTLLAATLALVWLPSGAGEAVEIFAMLFAGLWLREINYAYWAACMTLVFALLARPAGGVDAAMLGSRLEAIALGALCAVAATWFVFPIRTEAVIRRRLADALLALDELVARAHLSDADRTQTLARFEHRMAELEGVAAPVRWHRRLTSDVPEHPAGWIELANSIGGRAREFVRGARHAEHRTAVRRAIGASRRAIGQHGKGTTQNAAPVSVALRELHDTLQT